MCVGCYANAPKLAPAEILTCSSRLIKASVWVCVCVCVCVWQVPWRHAFILSSLGSVSVGIKHRDHMTLDPWPCCVLAAVRGDTMSEWASELECVCVFMCVCWISREREKLRHWANPDKDSTETPHIKIQRGEKGWLVLGNNSPRSCSIYERWWRML